MGCSSHLEVLGGIRGVGVSGVYWGLAGTLGTQDHKGIEGIRGHWGTLRGCRGCFEVSGGIRGCRCGKGVLGG